MHFLLDGFLNIYLVPYVVMLRDKYGAVANYEFFQSLGCGEKLGLGWS